MKVLHVSFPAIFLLFFNFPNAGAQTFSGQGGLPFPPGAPAQTIGITTSVAMVSGVGVLGGCNQIDNVTIDLSHTWVGDIALFLISPSGTVLELSSGNGGFGDNYQVTTFSDAAFTPITAGAPPFNGGFLPEGRQQSTACPCSNAGGVGTFTFANTFNGENADGPWQLFLNDYVFADVGTLNSWSISFAGNGAAPIANPISYGQCGTVGGQAVFDLTFIESAVHGGSGFPVFWYTDMQATNPITNPANYVSGATTIYAVVQGPNCSSNPAPITLVIVPGPVAIPQMVDVCSNCAGWAQVNLTDYNNAVNGGSGNIVNWWGDANATLLVPDPTSVQVFGASYWATVEDGGCESAPVEVDFTLLIPNCGANASLSACNTGNGTGVFDLTSVNNIVNLGTNDQVNWYEDPNATIPIANPAAYLSGGGAVYAVVFDGTCPSVPRGVTLTVTAGGGGANPAALDGCDNGAGQAVYDLTSVENTVNGGSGNPVSWWVDAAATIPITNPVNYVSSGGAVYATVTQGACTSSPVPVTLSLSPAPAAAPYPLNGCDAGSGIGTFDLTSIEFFVNFATGNPVSWFTDPSASNPISNPAGYQAGEGSVFAVVSNGVCASQPAEITLNIVPTPTISNATISPNPSSLCGPGNVSITFNMPEAGVPFTVTMQYGNPASGYQNYTGVNVFNGSTVPFIISETTEFILTSVSVPNNIFCAVTFPNPITVTVPANGAPVLNLLSNPTICTGETADLNATVTSPSGLPITFHSATPATPANQLPSPLAAPTATTTYFAFIDGGGGCTNELPVTVTVNPPAAPQLSPATVCQSESSFNLGSLQDPAYPAGTWSGPGVTGNTFSAAGLTGSVTLSFEPFAACSQPATTTITILPEVAPNLGTANVCESESSFNLATLQDPAFPGGAWSGPGVSGSTFNAAGLSGPVTLSYTPAQPCATPATAIVNVVPSVTPVLGTVELCSNDPLYPLSDLADPAYPTGAWSGPGVAGNAFNPAGLSGFITLSFLSDENCAVPASTTVTVIPASAPQLANSIVCESETSFNLSSLQDPAYPAGTWSGPGVTGSTFSAAGLTGSVTLSFEPFAACTQPGNTAITILPEAAPNLATASICANETAINLSPLQDPDFPSGVWNGPGVTGNIFNLAGQNGTVTLTFTPDTNCSQPATTSVVINETPVTSAPAVDCAPNNLSYTVRFDITGGAPGSYTVNGQPSGAAFVSAPIASGSPFSFLVDDGDGCGPVEVNGSFNCDCVTFAGSMDLTGGPFEVCSDEIFTAAFNNNAALDGDDALFFVLHDEPGASLGNVLATSASPSFGLPVNGQPGATYYVSAVAGNDDGSGSFDPADGCLSVAAGVPVVFYETAASIGAGGAICAGECFQVALSFEGVAPFEFSYQIDTPSGSSNEVFTASQANAQLDICTVGLGVASGRIVVQPIGMTDANGCNVSLSGSQNVFIEVLPEPSANLALTLCPGESLTVNGAVYDEANPTGSEVFPNGSAQGCDSIVNVSLSFYPAATGQLSQTLCTGSSIVVNGTVYDENNPAGTEILPNASANGCDSLVQVSLSFNDAVNFGLTETLCPGESRTVNGAVYDEANPTGSEVFPNGSAQGCDSIVNVSLSFYPAATGQLSQTLCTGSSIVVNGTVYDENNPMGIETLPNASANGCDSLVQVSLSFNDAVNFGLTETLCPGESRTVNGAVYDEANPTGAEVFPNGSAQGCDSIVNVSLSFYPAATGQLSQTLCTGSSIVVNGTVYDENNPAGTETLPNASANGCDSLVQVSLSFNDAVNFGLTETLCPGESRTVNGAVYDEANPTGSEVFPNGSAQGCDSIVNVSLSFYPAATGQLSQTLCTGSSIVVNGTVYDENNPAGTEILPNASANGCDSLVQVSLSFNDAVNFGLTETLCPGESRTVNGAVYDEANPTGAEVFPNGSAQGCDSIVNVSLSFYPAATGQLSQTLCTGSSIVVNGTVYDENNPAGTETLPNASANGCDSLVQVSLSFNDAVNFGLTETLCPGESRTVNGAVYDEANPTGSEVFPNGSAQGCDSIVNVSLSFYPAATGQLSQTLCTGSSIVVNGTVYDENNPAGTEILPNASANGCDSLVQVSLSFNDAVNFGLTETLCPGESRTVNGAVYDEANPTGSEVFPNGSAQGCDSIVNVSLSFYPAATGQLSQTLCTGSSIVVNGTVYDENNPAGTETLPNASANGCDSLVQVSLSFNDAVNFGLTETLCPGESLMVNGAVYDEANPAGSEVFPNGSAQGCDSIVNVSLSFYPEVVFELMPTLNPGENIIVNGAIYDESNPDGFEVLENAAASGCDSTVIISLAFEAEEPRKSRDIFVPNAFSPNDDGRNDRLTVFAGEAVVSVRTFRIFDRWGGAVFEQSGFTPNDVSKGWDGTHRGKALDPAVFVYFAEVEFLDGAVELVKGEVVLVR